MSSILTNTSSMVALQTLNRINKGLAKVQDEISTGLKVATAKDDSSTWSIASTMDADIKMFTKLSELTVAAGATVGAARAAAENTADTLKKVAQKLALAEDMNAGSPELAAVQREVDYLMDTIESTGKATQINGINLTSAASTALTVTVSVIRSATGVLTTEAVTVATGNLEAIGLTAITAGTTTLDAVDDLIDDANEYAAAFGAAQIRIETQGEFLSAQLVSLKTALGTLIDADMEEASARLSALQTQQQLGIQSLAIANAAPQNVLALFK